jgi:hypothetical protein
LVGDKGVDGDLGAECVGVDDTAWPWEEEGEAWEGEATCFTGFHVTMSMGPSVRLSGLNMLRTLRSGGGASSWMGDPCKM